MTKTALITGITGQDGAYLAEFLLGKGYAVHGIARRSSSANTGRIDHLLQPPSSIHLHHGDMTDGKSLVRIINDVRPGEVYNLAAQSHVHMSFDSAEYTTNVDALGPLRILEALRILGMRDHTRFYQASTSELFGKARETPQRESTPFHPRSPYGVAKLYGYWITVNYREAYNMHASNGILFNHESPRRGESFVTRKITTGVAAIHLGMIESIALGNLDARRDWGHARDYVEGMWMILQQDVPDDYVLATGKTHTVREFVELAFARVGRPVKWQGSGIGECGVDQKTGRTVVTIDPAFFRPAEVELLLGDAAKAHQQLGWRPTTTLEELVNEMVDADVDRQQRRQRAGLGINA